MGVDRIQTVRKATTPPMSVIGNYCPVAILAEQVATLIKAAEVVMEEDCDLTELSTEQELTKEQTERQSDLNLLFEALEERRSAIEGFSALEQATSPVGAIYQLLVLYDRYTTAEDDASKRTFEEWRADLKIARGLTASIFGWIVSSTGISPDEMMVRHYMGGNNPHKTLKNALNHKKGAPIADDAMAPYIED